MKRENATATLVMHIPSGIDAYSSTRACGFSSSPVPYFAAGSGDALANILQRYPDQVRAIFTGHSHMDDFRVLSDSGGKPFAYERVIPSVTPFFRNNPGYQIYSYERATGAPSTTGPAPMPHRASRTRAPGDGSTGSSRRTTWENSPRTT